MFVPPDAMLSAPVELNVDAVKVAARPVPLMRKLAVWSLAFWLRMLVLSALAKDIFQAEPFHSAMAVEPAGTIIVPIVNPAVPELVM